MTQLRNVEELDDLATQWQRHLLSRNRSPKTIESYIDSAKRLALFLRTEGRSTDAPQVDRRAVEAFIASQLEYHRPATAALRFRSLQQFFRWLTEEEIVPTNPMARMKPPSVPETPVAVISDEDLRKLLATCQVTRYASSSGVRDFENRRDYAILRLFIDTPTRLSEMANLVVDGPEGSDLLIPDGVVRIFGKGAKTRYAAIGPKAATALDGYLRARKAHPSAPLPWLWLGIHGHFTNAGISQMLRRRCKRAGIDHIHPHQFRHTFAHTWLHAGGNEGDLMELAGWSSHEMLRRYAKSTAAQRAQAAYRRIDVGSRV